MEPSQHDTLDTASSCSDLSDGTIEYLRALFRPETVQVKVQVPRLGLRLRANTDKIQFTMTCINKDVAHNAAALVVDFIDGVVERFQLSPPQDLENPIPWAWRLLAEQRSRKRGMIYRWTKNPDKYCDLFTPGQLHRVRFLATCDEAELQERLHHLLNPPQSPLEHSSDHDERKSNEDSSDSVTRHQRPWEGAHDGARKQARIAVNPRWTETRHPFVFFHRQDDSTLFRLNKLGWCLLHWELDADHNIDAYCSETIEKVCNHDAMDGRDMHAFYSETTRDWVKFFYNQQPWVLHELGQAVKHGLQQAQEFELDVHHLQTAHTSTEDVSGLESGEQKSAPELWLKHLVVRGTQLPANIVEHIGSKELFVELRCELGSEIVRCAAILSEQPTFDPITREPTKELQLKLTGTSWNKLQHLSAATGAQMFCKAILGLTPHLRYFTICIAPPVGNRIIPKVVACKGSSWILDGQNLAGLTEFDPVQLSRIVDWKLDNNPAGEIMFVEAPPGTGKSTAACELVRVARQQEKRVLCSTYSVEALSVLVEKFFEQVAEEDNTHRPRVVVAASMHNRRLNTNFKRFCLDRRQHAWGAIEKIKQQLQVCVEQIQKAITAAPRIDTAILHEVLKCHKLMEDAATVATDIAFTHWEPSLPKALRSVRSSASEGIKTLASIIALLQSRSAESGELGQVVENFVRGQMDGLSDVRAGLVRVQKELNDVLEQCSWYETDEGLLSFADVVFATLLITGRRRGFPSMTAPHLLVVDEAAQATQLATMLALNTNPGLAVFLGDTRQLEPFVSEAAEKAGYGCSTMYRYRKQQGDQRWNELAVMMRVQYRMHPTICDMVSSTFYESRLSSADDLQHYRAVHAQVQDVIKPLCFVDICGQEQQQHPGTSRFNEDEADLCVEIVEYLLRNDIPANDIGVVAAYAAQTQELEERFGQRSTQQQTLSSVKVGSIDSFQGREKDYIILSCVRAQRKIGFLSVPNRINVAVTRARRSVIIVGHAATFMTREDAKIFSVLGYCKLREPSSCRYLTAREFKPEIAA